MDRRWLVRLEIPKIQRYVFGSEVLREIVGASFLVRQATEDWPRSVASDPDQEIISAGGGRTLALFKEIRDSKAFCRELSWRLLTKSPGLPFFLVSEQLDWDVPGELHRAVDATNATVQCLKLRGLSDARLGATPVTARCQSTSQAATTYVDEPGGSRRAVSSDTSAKRLETLLSDANRHLKTSFGNPKPNDYPLDFDELGRSRGESSYVGVVHIDGNRVGATIQHLTNQFPALGNDQYLNALRDIATSIEKAGKNALRQLLEWINDDKAGALALLKDDLTPLNGGTSLPIRPLVYGGDDTTFVCDGRIALEAAVRYLWAFEMQNITVGATSVPLRASAGVAIVKSHYPFSRAYGLADELIESAKRFGKTTASSDSPAPYPSAIDWHFAQTGIHRSLEGIRQRLDRNGVTLVSRPLLLNDAPSTAGSLRWRTWPEFTRLLTTFSAGNWDKQRAKRHGLFEALQEGPVAAEHYIDRHLNNLPEVSASLSDDYRRTGFDDGRCVYFDALEAVAMSAYVTPREEP